VTTKLAPAFTACCSTAVVASAVVTMPVTAVAASPALRPSTVSAFQSTAICFLMRSITSCAESADAREDLPPVANGATAAMVAIAANLRLERCDIVASPIGRRHITKDRKEIGMRVRLGASVSLAMFLASVAIPAAQTAPPATPPATTPATQGAGAQRGAGPAGAPQGTGRGFAPVVIGPSAPVPPEVTIPRPTPEELAQVNDAVRKFIAADASPTKPLLKKFESLLLLQPARKNVAATFTQTVQRQGPRHEGFVEIAKQGNIDLLLHGDSITDWWVQNDANNAVFEKYFGGIRTANFAVAGDTTQGVLWGLRNGEGQGFQPKAVMLMIGTNNSGAYTAPEIAEGVGAVVLELRRNFPDAKILLLAIFPRGFPNDPIRDKLAEANRIISRLDDQKRVFYMDIGAKFLDEKGSFLPDAFRPDNLHPQARGYEIWGEAVKDKLAELLK
jgi:lysophospholipase L1-like esterase